MESDDPRILAFLGKPEGNLSFGFLKHQQQKQTTIKAHRMKKRRRKDPPQRRVAGKRQKLKRPRRRKRSVVVKRTERSERLIVRDSVKRRTGWEAVRGPNGGKEVEGKQKRKIRKRNEKRRKRRQLRRTPPTSGGNPRISRIGRKQ